MIFLVDESTPSSPVQVPQRADVSAEPPQAASPTPPAPTVSPGAPATETAAATPGAPSTERAPDTESSAPSGAPAGGVAPSRPDAHSGFRARGRVRRRARFLRKARELAYRDLGGLVFNLHRFRRRNDALVVAKLDTLTQIDSELRATEAALSARQPITVLREAGVTACARCAAIHSSEDRFCPGCGLALDRHTDLPIAGTVNTPANPPSAQPAGPPPAAAAPAPATPAASSPAATPSPAHVPAVAPAPAHVPPAPAIAPAPAAQEPPTQVLGPRAPDA
jgi:hypothetical protein